MTPSRTRSLLLALAVGLTAVLLGAAPASAHAALTGSDPADGTTLQEVPAEVTFTFNEDIADPAFVVVTAAGERVEQGDVRVDGNEVSVDVASDATPGAWTAAYRVVSTDGHPVTGEIGFEVAQTAPSPGLSEVTPSATAEAAPGDPEPTTPDFEATSVSTSEDGGFLGLHAEHLVVGAILLALAAGVLTWALRRRTG